MGRCGHAVFFEGVVMKRADSIYPVQLRSATEECRGWCSIGLLRKGPSATNYDFGWVHFMNGASAFNST
jgi:hypothetical protein